MAALGLALAAHGQFIPDREATVSAPVAGIAATDGDYLLTYRTVTASLPQKFTDSSQAIPLYANPVSAQDAASFNNEFMFQLGIDYNIRQINLVT